MSRLFSLLIVLCAAACQSLPPLSERETSSYIPTRSAPRLETAFMLPEDTAASEPAAASTPAVGTDSVRLPEKQPETPAYRGFALPGDPDAPPYSVRSITRSRNLTDDVSDSLTSHPAHILVLDNAQDSYTARAELIDHADVSLDIQYYIWRSDISGRLLMQKLWQAAERGVRVRLLLDDNNTRGMDNILAALNRHPRIQIRLFNPFLYRKWRFLGYLTDFPRLNRRMHNKTLTADNRLSILGGRNIGDEYFDISTDTSFSDMDVLVGGRMVDAISQDFDRYWQSDSAYPLEKIAKRADSTEGMAELFDSEGRSPAGRELVERLNSTRLQQALNQKNLHYISAPVQLVSDDPAKALDRRTTVDIASALGRAMQEPQREIYLVSPYFVPTRTGTALLRQLARQGIDITVFTNSLRATDVAAVHSGYARYRKPLLEAGIELYELKPEQAVPKGRDKGLTGSPATSLHAKTFVFDKERIFVGSLNLDPRSTRLNTEMGLIIHHPGLAADMENRLQGISSQTAYRVSLNRRGRIQWRDPQTGITSTKEPDAGVWKRLFSNILSVLPIERLL